MNDKKENKFSLLSLVLLAIWTICFIKLGIIFGGIIALIITMMVGAGMTGSNKAKADRYLAQKYDEEKEKNKDK